MTPEERRELNRATIAARREAARRDGVTCTKCASRPRDPEHLWCETCLESKRAQRRRRRAAEEIKTMPHRHRPNEKMWTFPAKVGAQSAGGRPFQHNPRRPDSYSCDAHGAHIITDVCSCGAERIVCPAGPGRKQASAWIEPMSDDDY